MFDEGNALLDRIIEREQMARLGKLRHPVVVDVEDIVAGILGSKECAHVIVDRVAGDQVDLDPDSGLPLELGRKHRLCRDAPRCRQKHRPQRRLRWRDRNRIMSKRISNHQHSFQVNHAGLPFERRKDANRAFLLRSNL